MQGILWGKKRDKQKEKNGIRTDVIVGLPEKRKCPGFIRGSKSVPVPSGQKGRHASPAFTGQLGSCRSIHTTEGTTFDLEITHVSKVMETVKWQMALEWLQAPTNQRDKVLERDPSFREGE